MVRDFLLDMKERDLLFSDKSNSGEPIFDSVWGNIFDEDEAADVLICNIIIPEIYWESVKYDDGVYISRFKSAYFPDTRHFRIRLVAMKDGDYKLFPAIRGDFGLPANSFAITKNIASPIPASMLPFIDLDGEYLVKFVQNTKNEALDKAYIYSAKQTDISVYFSDNQASQLLSICAPGKSYRYPTTGVGATNYLNRVVAHSDMDRVLDKQFLADGRPIQDAEFDNVTGKLDVLFSPEREVADTGLDSIDDLNVGFFSLFDDEFVRRNVVISELSDAEFLEMLDLYERTLNLFIFIDDTTTASRITNNVVAGRFDGEGNIVPSDEYYIVSAALEAGSIIMFDDELEDSISDAPVFIVNDVDESRLYTALVEQPYWVKDICHKCFILKHRAMVKYMIKKSQFAKNKGLFLVEHTSSNIKNMLGVVQDIHTGRLLGIVSNNTNISDITLDEFTQRIYATQISQ